MDSAKGPADEKIGFPDSARQPFHIEAPKPARPLDSKARDLDHPADRELMIAEVAGPSVANHGEPSGKRVTKRAQSGQRE
jgi:hypothetical protein